jgi:hypothetical protein
MPVFLASGMFQTPFEQKNILDRFIHSKEWINFTNDHWNQVIFLDKTKKNLFVSRDVSLFEELR